MDKKKVSLFYFSGTGNTKLVCEQLSQSIEKQNQGEVHLTSIESTGLSEAIQEAQLADYVGIAFPVYGLGAPRNILEFSKRLAEQLQSTKKIFILMTAGDMIGINHAAAQQAIQFFEAKGHPVVYERLIVMGANFFIQYKIEFNQQLYEVSQGKTAHMAEELLSGKVRRLKPSSLVKVVAKYVHMGESQQGAKKYGKSLESDETCSGCGHCVKKCPVGNLSLNGKSVKGSDVCIMCMRCVYDCPSRSLHSKGMNWVVLKEGYYLDKIVNRPQASTPFVHRDTKGFYKHFFNYINDVSL